MSYPNKKSIFEIICNGFNVLTTRSPQDFRNESRQRKPSRSVSGSPIMNGRRALPCSSTPSDSFRRRREENYFALSHLRLRRSCHVGNSSLPHSVIDFRRSLLVKFLFDFCRLVIVRISEHFLKLVDSLVISFIGTSVCIH